MLDLVSAIEQALGKKAIIREVPIQPGDVPRTWADGTALREELNYTAQTALTEGTKSYVAWYRRHNHGAQNPMPPEDPATHVSVTP